MSVITEHEFSIMKLLCNFGVLGLREVVIGWWMEWATRATATLIHGTWFTEPVVVLFFLETVVF